MLKSLRFPLFLLGFFVLFLLGKNWYMKPSAKHGTMAPVFSATNSDGKKIALEDFKGKYVLLDFWGSWCGPCLTEMPDLKAFHQKYVGKSFENASSLEIISIAIEEDESRWRRALERLQLPWQNQLVDISSSLRFLNSPIATQYGVKEVPNKFLLNEQGEIMGINLSFEEMSKLLDKRLKP